MKRLRKNMQDQTIPSESIPNRTDSSCSTSSSEASWDENYTQESGGLRGVSIDFLLDLLTEYQLQDLSMKDVVDKVVCPISKKKRQSVVEIFRSYDEIVGRSTHFVTYSYNMPFIALVETLQRVSASWNDKAYFWIDVFCINQNHYQTAIQNKRDWMFRDDLLRERKNTIREVGNTLAILYPRENPEILKESWSLYECFCALTSKDKKLEFLTVEDFEVNTDKYDKMFEDLDTTIEGYAVAFEDSRSRFAHEYEWLTFASSSLYPGGLKACNEKLQFEIYEWLCEKSAAYFDKYTGDKVAPSKKTLRSMSVLASLLTKLGLFEAAFFLLKYVRTSLLTCPEKTNDLKADVNYLMGNLIAKHSSKLDTAEILLRSALAVRVNIFGKCHEKSCDAMEALGKVLQTKSMHSEAATLFEDSLMGRLLKNGSESLETLMSRNLLALSLQYQGRLYEAEKLLRKIVQMGETVIERKSESLYVWKNNLAICLQKQGDINGAESLLRKGLLESEQYFGPLSTCTLKFVRSLARCLLLQKRPIAAEAFFRRELNANQTVYGKSHKRTMECLHSLVPLLKSQNRIQVLKDLQAKFAENTNSAFTSVDNNFNEAHQDREWITGLNLQMAAIQV